jgi:HEAT repeat protein
MDGPTSQRTLLATLASLALTLGQPGCTGPVGTTAGSAMRKARESGDPNVRHMAYERLGTDRAYDDEGQKAEATKLMAARLESKGEPTASRAVLCRSLGQLGRAESQSALRKAVEDPEAVVRAEACRALGTVGSAEDAATLARIMAADTSIDCRVAAIEGLERLKPRDHRIAAALAEAMDHNDPAVRTAALKALRSISGKDFGLASKPWREYANSVASARSEPTAR